MQRPGVVIFSNKSKICRNESKSPKYGVLVQLLDAVQSPIQRKRKMLKIRHFVLNISKDLIS